MPKNRVYENRKLRGYSQCELAEIVGLQQSLIASYEKPSSPRKPTLENAMRIAIALQCRIDDVLPGFVLPLPRELSVLINTWPALGTKKHDKILEAIKPHVRR